VSAHDPQTLTFYDRDAEAYAERERPLPRRRLQAFMGCLSPRATILELGCGAGIDAAYLIERGFQVEATDGSPELAALAAKRLNRPVRVMLFDELDEAGRYDGVWANASLHHAPDEALPGILQRIHRALRPDGLFAASYKSGDGEGRDSLGRYYSFPTEGRLRAAYAAAGWSDITLEHGEGRGYDGVPRPWLFVTAVKG
jgi:SAM-dependent methyltransferase